MEQAEHISFLSWMAWTWPTALFFSGVLIAIASIGVWDYVSPEAGPRHGILGLDTTRGDRLFITLLGSAFIMLGWLGMMSTPLWGGVIISVIWGLIIFRWA